jgi:hypothetical protein
VELGDETVTDLKIRRERLMQSGSVETAHQTPGPAEMIRKGRPPTAGFAKL